MAYALPIEDILHDIERIPDRRVYGRVAAILGMLPIAREVFWGPMAYAVIGGLAVATALTLVFLPALYVAWFRVEEPQGTGGTPRETLAPEQIHGYTPEV